MPDGRMLEKRITDLQADVSRLWRALLRVEPRLTRYDYDLEGEPTRKICRLCGAQAVPNAEICHKQSCPFAELVFPAGTWPA